MTVIAGQDSNEHNFRAYTVRFAGKAFEKHQEEISHAVSLILYQCCESGGSAWICIILVTRIRFRINLQMTSQNVWNMSLFFKGFELSFGS
jgi:hypothetical protein